MATASAVHAAPFTLSNGTSNGTVTVGVDGFGSFGSSIGSNATNAILNRTGGGNIGTTFESALAIRTNPLGTFDVLTSGNVGGSGGLENPLIDGGSQFAASTFDVGNLRFFLTQTLEPITPDATDGSVLNQLYAIENTGNTTIDFELIRYVDFDIGNFGNDGGGGIQDVPLFGETLFTNGPAGRPNPTDVATYVGITANTETNPETNRFETRNFPALITDLVNVPGYLLADTIQGDTNGNGFQNTRDDITMGLRNTFSLAPGQVAYYTTKTIWGAGTTSPEEGTGFLGTATVPEPGMIAMMGAGLAGLAALQRRRKKKVAQYISD